LNSYRTESREGSPADGARWPSGGATGAAAGSMPALLPLSSAEEALHSLAIPLLSAGSGGWDTARSTVGSPVSDSQAEAIVADAVSILDEEMARGVVAARTVGQTFDHKRANSGDTLMTQLHEVINNVARLWPALQAPSTAWTRGAEPGRPGAHEVPQLKPGSPLRPGQRATISMTLQNNESRSVRLVPAATDLLGSSGDRISWQRLAFVPTEISLAPGEQRPIEISVAVPPEVGPGCYSGMLVMTGVSYLSAMIAIEIA
jgi:hypothetical protein